MAKNKTNKKNITNNSSQPATATLNSSSISPHIKPVWVTYKTHLLILSLFSLLLYFNTIFNDYSVDDHFVVNTVTDKGFNGLREIFTTNFTYHNGKGDSYRAIARASIAVENEIFGKSAGVHHFFNIIYYALCIVVAFTFLIRLLGHEFSSLIFIGLLLFTAHPVHVEVVASLKSRDELFCFLFGILACSFGFAYHNYGKISDALLMGFFLTLSIMSKENGPQYLAVLLLSCFTYGQKNYRRLVSLTLVALVIISLYLYFYFKILSDQTVLWDESIESRFIFVESQLQYCRNFSERYGTAFYGLLYYLKILIYPFPLSSFYGYSMIPNVGFSNIWVIISLVVYLLMILSAIFFYKKNPLISYIILFYFSSLLIFSNLLVPVNGVIAERHIFLGSLPFCLFIAMVIFWVFKFRFNEKITTFKKNTPFRIILSVLLIIYSVKTISRNTEWKNTISLSSIDAKRNPNSGMIQLYNGLELRKELEKEGTDKDLSLNTIITRFENVIKIDTNYPYPHIQLGDLYLRYKKDTIQAEFHFTKAISLNPKARYYYNILSDLYINKGETKKLMSLMKQMEKNIPEAYEPYYQLGLYAYREKDIPNAVIMFDKAIKKGCQDIEVKRFLSDYYESNKMWVALDSLNNITMQWQ